MANMSALAANQSYIHSLTSGTMLAGSVNIGYPSSYSNNYNDSNGSKGSHGLGNNGFINSSCGAGVGSN